MNRRAFVTGLGAVLAAPFVSEAQRADKLWRIGSVLGGTPESSGKVAKAIEASLAAAGYVPGRSITLEHRFYTDAAGADQAIRAIVPTVDLLVVGGTVGAVAAKKVSSLPTVFFTVGDPVRIGLFPVSRTPAAT